jgi:beta-N-acetylhexosaminidase
MAAPLACVFGCAGTLLDGEEESFFRDADPLGFILFQRNCVSPAQVRALVQDLRACVGRADAPVLIDQEGGRVARLKPPAWRAAPPAARIGERARRDMNGAIECARINARLIAEDLAALGINANCAPVLDLRLPITHQAIGDRAFSDDPAIVAALGRAACEGFLAGGVVPVLKHMPGHGRATADSHLELPRVDAPLAELRGADFMPFKALSDMPWGMTAHLLFSALDAEQPATTSPRVIADIIRGEIGFDGLLFSDDLSMQALAGSLRDRAGRALAAGCDVALHCNGRMAEMLQVAEAAASLSAAASRRVARGLDAAKAPERIDVAAARARFDSLMAA